MNWCISCYDWYSCCKGINNRKAYQYLSESIKTFYSAENFCKLLESKGFHLVNIKKYANGAAYLYVATRI